MSSLLFLLSMENEDYLIKSLDEQKNTIEKFNEYLSDLIKEMNGGNYNMPVLNILCNFIKEYNKKTIVEESESDSDSDPDPESSKLLSSEEQSEDESEEEDDEEKKIQIIKSETVRIDEMKLIYENFLNNNSNINKLFTKPSYDIQKNMDIFIGKSNKY